MNNVSQKDKRRDLRRNQTSEEKMLWHMLRAGKTGLKWRRQVSIGAYVADFYCPSIKLVIELDGDQHLTAVEYDGVRDSYFGALGIKVIRISNKTFNGDLEIIYQKIKEHLSS